MTEKFAKADVDYSRGKPRAHCGLCEHYRANLTCEIVAGHIEPQMWCEKFKHETVGADVRKAMS